MGILDAFYSLGRNLNKQKGKDAPENVEGVVSERFPELKLEMTNEDLLKLTKKWQKSWKDSNAYREWQEKSKENEDYWKGNHYQKAEGDKTRGFVDNIIFESLETYLPQVTRRNPEPMVALVEGEEQLEENLAFAKNTQKYLGQIADELNLRIKLKKTARYWAVFLLGVGKLGWDTNKDIPTVKIVRPGKLILDPEATVDEDGYTGEFIGEYRKLQASVLISQIEAIGGEEKVKEIIMELVKGETGTEVQFIEWWTDAYMCWTLGEHVLLKKKNPHWNYDSEKINETVDEYGRPMQVPQTILGINHLPVPKKPYILLSVFNLGTQPVDDTSLIGQNLSNQDLINKRLRQIDKNADGMNSGMVVSQERSGLTKEQAKGVTEALKKGGTIVIPSGAPREAIDRFPNPGLPSDIYNQLADTRNRLRDIFGTRGSTPAGIEGESTVRGKLITRNMDTDRIGGGISEYLEQFADEIYNWFIQLLYVYDDTYATLKAVPKITVSVKEGSLLPKDSTTIANQAIELANAGKMSIVDLYKRLDYPNPEELAANVWLEINAPEILYANDERVVQVIQSRQDASVGKPPSTSISFKDLPPDGQSQLAKQAGIDLNPEAIAAYDEAQREADKPETPEDMPLPPV